MASEKPRNIAASVHQRLLNYAGAQRVDPNLVLIWYGLERFLYRLSVSSYSDRFVLKGAMLFRLWGDAPYRPTKDLDLLGFVQREIGTVQAAFAEICTQAVEDDGLVFDPHSVRVSEIREQPDYGGLRVSLTTRLGTARITLQIDVGFGDAVTPAATLTDFPSILGQTQPRIRAYPRETVVAEKFEAIVQLGMINTRMKDYYDLWFMAQQFTFDGELLKAAIRATFDPAERRSRSAYQRDSRLTMRRTQRTCGSGLPSPPGLPQARLRISTL